MRAPARRGGAARWWQLRRPALGGARLRRALSWCGGTPLRGVCGLRLHWPRSSLLLLLGDWLGCWRKLGRRRLRTPLPPWRRPFALLGLPMPDVAGENLTHLGLASAAFYSDTTFLKATLGYSGWRRWPSAECATSSLFSSSINKFVACAGAARVEDPIRPGRVCRGPGRRPNPTRRCELRPGLMSQSDLGSGDEPCLWRLPVRAGGATEIPAAARRW